MKIGPNFTPFYAKDQGKDLGVDVLAGGAVEARRRRRSGAGSPTTRRPTCSSTAPAIPASGTRICAPATTSGRARSSRATPTPARRAGPTRSTAHDSWDYDEIMENMLVDMDYGGRRASCSIHPGRTGFVYVLDRETGELLSAETFEPTNWASGYDLKTGKPIEDPAKRTHFGTVTQGICPVVDRREGRHSVGVLAAHRACSTSPRTTPAWTTRASRRTTSPARRTSAPT